MSIVVSFIGIFIIGIIITAIVLVVVLILKNKKSMASHPNAPNLKKSLGEVLKEHRTRCNMTQEFVAGSLGVTRQAVSKWETGDSDPSTSNLLELAKIYGVSAAKLLESIE